MFSLSRLAYQKYGLLLETVDMGGDQQWCNRLRELLEPHEHG
jgi:hypothetical protein